MSEKDDFHVDMSSRIYWKKTIGIALIGTQTRINCGCALNTQLLKKIKKELFEKDYYDSAKLYAICIFMLVDNVKNLVNELIVCNDEDFRIVKNILNYLLKDYDFEIINISEFRRRFGRNIGSLADNYANIYRKKALKPTRYNQGKKINVVKISFKKIKQYWRELDENKM